MMKRYLLIFLIIILGIINMTFAESKHLSLRDKIGQMLILGFDGKTVDKDSPIVHAIIDDNLGGVILFDYNFKTKTFDKNIESPEQVKKLNRALQSMATLGNKNHHRSPLPLIISVDYEGGRVNRLGEKYGFPSTISAENFAKLDISSAEEVANTMSNTLKDNGFNLDFAPMLDLKVNPNNPVIGKLERSYSQDPSIASMYSDILSQALIKNKLACAYKHFPGHGSSSNDSHLGFVDVSDTWQDDELIPYKTAFQNMRHCPMVMSAHIVNRQLDPTGLPATLSKPILTDLLRRQLGFEGVVVSDDMQMKAISAHYGLEKAVVMAINAGADMLIFGNQLSDTPVSAKQLIDIIERNVNSGQIDPKRIEQAYTRIEALKQTL